MFSDQAVQAMENGFRGEDEKAADVCGEMRRQHHEMQQSSLIFQSF